VRGENQVQIIINYKDMIKEKKTVLIIEDEQTLLKLLQKAFEKEDIKTLIALDGEKGINLARKEKPDLILLDIILPKKSGFDVLEELKADAETKNIPVVVLTNLSEVVDVEKVLELGAVTYLVKSSYKLEEIVEKVKDMLK